MSEARLERTRRAYDRVIDLGPMGCKILDVGTQDNRFLNSIWTRDQILERDGVRPALQGWNVIEGEHFASDAERHPVTEGFIVNRDLGDEA